MSVCRFCISITFPFVGPFFQFYILLPCNVCFYYLNNANYTHTPNILKLYDRRSLHCVQTHQRKRMKGQQYLSRNWILCVKVPEENSNFKIWNFILSILTSFFFSGLKRKAKHHIYAKIWWQLWHHFFFSAIEKCLFFIIYGIKMLFSIQ